VAGQGVNCADVGTLLVEFFVFYASKFNIMSDVVTIRLGRLGVSKHTVWKDRNVAMVANRLSIEDPFNLHHDLGACRAPCVRVTVVLYGGTSRAVRWKITCCVRVCRKGSVHCRHGAPRRGITSCPQARVATQRRWRAMSRYVPRCCVTNVRC
jgi:hypothetical protein